MMNVLVTDGENRSSLAVTRSLGRAGYAVFVSAARTNTISSSSKFCRKAFCVPDPVSTPSEYVKAIIKLVKTESIDVLMPMTEQSIYCINNHRLDFPEELIIASATTGQMKQISNKSSLFELAALLGVPIPETIHVISADSFLKHEPCINQFPVVVKPAYSKMYFQNRIVSSGVMYASNYSELRQLYETKEILHHPSLIQEMIPGEGTGLFTLFDLDRHLALFSHRRLLEKPPSGGVSVLCESVKLDNNMVSYAQNLLEAVGWQGVAMVEFKRDTRDGIPKLMEINGRFWGSLQLAISCGVDFPVLCLDYYLGKKPLEMITHYETGHKLRWFLGMLDHVLIRLKKHGSIINMPPETPALIEVISKLLFMRKYTHSDVFDKRDINPVLNELKQYLVDIVR